MKKIFLNIILIAIATAAMADAVGTWKLYPSYSNISEVQYVKADSSECFVLSDGNLFAYYNSDNTFAEFMIEGAGSATGTSYGILSGRDIKHIAWCASAKKLVIVYSDGLIDLLNTKDKNNPYVGSVVGLQETTLFNDKTVDSIFVSGQYAYLVTTAHIIKVDVKEEFIVKTFNTANSTEVDEMNSAQLMVPVTLNYKFGSNTIPDGPASNYCWRLYKHDGKIFSTAGNFSANMQSYLTQLPGEVDYLDNGKWKKLPMPADYIAANVMQFDPKNTNHFWVGGLCGLLEYNGYDAVANQYLPGSSTTLTSIYNGGGTTQSLITTMTVDASNNLWMMNGWADPAIQRRSTSGQWTAFPHQDMISFSDLTSVDHQRLFISPTNGLMWWVHHYYNHAIIFRYNYNTDQVTAIKSFTNQDGVSIDVKYTKCITEDSEGNMWICTEKGPLVLLKDDVTLDKPTFEQPKVNRNDGSGLADYLLSSIICHVVKFDKAGRKWFGTEDGVYLISSDGQEQLAHYTTENSPLCANLIYDILIDDETGIVYFATEKGICSFNSDVTSTYGDLSNDNVYAYPNPVLSGYNGNITIMGLTDGSMVKIVNTAGQIVHSGTCKGGSFTWSGCDGTGGRVASGVYMVLVSNADGEDGCVTKIAVIK